VVAPARRTERIGLSLLGERHGGSRRLALLVVVAVGAALSVQGPAGAAPRPTLKQVKDQVEALHEQAEVATEKYNDTKERIEGLKLQVSAAQQKVTEQERAVVQAQRDLSRIAVDAYKAGDLATLSLFFDDDPDKYLAAGGLMLSVGDRRATAVESLKRQRQALVAGSTDLEEQQQRFEQAMKDLQTGRTEVLAKLSKAQGLLSQLTEAERTQLGQQRTGAERTSLADLGVKVPASGQLTCQDVPISIPAGKAGKVLTYACAQIGDPYLWGADGPGSFDCSGLTMMAWKQAGVSLPHNAADQAGEGTPVTRSQLQAGDLVFFHSPISHVAIYIGNGLMLHAPSSGDKVKIVPLRSGMSAAVHL
jgi:peptidoglycan DL-endopeptidase CwlO